MDPSAAIPEPGHGSRPRRRHRHPSSSPLLLPLMATAAAALLLPVTTRAFLLPPSSSRPGRAAAAAVVVVGMGGKWQRDPGVMQGVADLVKSFRQREHEQTETADRYLQVRPPGLCVLSIPPHAHPPAAARMYVQDGMEAIRRLDARGALTAFETALRMDNEVRWGRTAMMSWHAAAGPSIFLPQEGGVQTERGPFMQGPIISFLYNNRRA